MVTDIKYATAHTILDFAGKEQEHGFIKENKLLPEKGLIGCAKCC